MGTEKHWFVKLMTSVIVLWFLVGISSGVAGAAPSATLVAIRAASHSEVTPHYDRVVFQIDGRLPDTISIQYVPKLIGDGSGKVVPIQGKAILRLSLSPAVAHTNTGQAIVPARIRYNLPLIQEVVGSGDFEGVVSYGVGISQKTEYRISTLTNPTRIVIDFVR